MTSNKDDATTIAELREKVKGRWKGRTDTNKLVFAESEKGTQKIWIWFTSESNHQLTAKIEHAGPSHSKLRELRTRSTSRPKFFLRSSHFQKSLTHRKRTSAILTLACAPLWLAQVSILQLTVTNHDHCGHCVDS